MPPERTAVATCPLCEATCGLEVDAERRPDRRASAVTRDDVFSHGYICPKGASLKALHDDPDRLTQPLVQRRRRARRGDLGRGLRRDRRAGCRRSSSRARRDAVARLPRQPGRPQPRGRCSTAACCCKALGTQQRLHGQHGRPDAQARHRRATCSATRSPSRSPTSTARDYLLMLGANPLVSNGSLMTAPDVRGRLRGDPRARRQGRRRRPAPHAHGRGRPTSTSPSARAPTRCCCSRSLHVLFDEGLVALGARSSRWSTASTRSRALAADFTPEVVAPPPASPPTTIRRIARELAARRAAAVYGRIGTTHAGVRHAGELARRRAQRRSPATSTAPAARCSRSPRPGRPTPRRGRGAAFRHGRWRSRVRGLPEVLRRAAGGHARRRDPDAGRRARCAR